MANVVMTGGSAEQGGFDMAAGGPAGWLSILVYPETIYSGNTTLAQFATPGALMRANGTFSNFNSDGPQQGTVTSFTFSYNLAFGGQTTMSVTGISLSVPSLWNWALVQDVAAVAAAVLGGADTFTGTQYADSISGYGGNDLINAGNGNDVIYGGDGADTMNGEGGSDTIHTGGAGDVLDGGDGDDYLGVTAGAGGLSFSFGLFDTAAGVVAADGSLIKNIEAIGFQGGAGNDTLTWSNNTRLPFGYFYAAGGNDHVVADLSWSSSNIVLGPAMVGGFYQLVGLVMSEVENLTVTTGSGMDSLTGSSGNDTLSSGDGNDTLTGGNGGNDILNAGAGNDTINILFSASVTALAGDGDDQISVYATTAATIDGGAGTDRITIYVGGHNVTLSAGGVSIAGSPTTITGVETVYVQGNPFGGDDTFTLIAPFTGTFGFAGDMGVDTFVADLSAQTANITLDYLGIRTTGNTIDGSLQSIEVFNVSGGSGNDSLDANGYAATFYGNDGNDFLRGGAGLNTLDGGAGNDTIISSGTGVLNGGDGVDALSLNLSSMTSGITVTSADMASNTGVTFANGAVVRNFESFSLTGGSGADSFTLVNPTGANSFYGGDGFDQLTIDMTALTGGSMDQLGTMLTFFGGTVGIGVERLTVLGGTTNNTLVGAERVDIFTGQGGQDSLSGSGGNDVLTGGGGNDFLLGGSGSDTLYGGDGNDILEGRGYNTYDQGTPDGIDYIYGGAGSDTLIASDALGGEYDGGAGFDTLQIWRTNSNVAYNFSSSALATAGGYVLPDGAIIRNIEGFRFVSGNADDTFTLDTVPLSGFENLYHGGGGFDRAIIQWGAVTTDVNLSSYNLTLENSSGVVTTTLLLVVEQHDITTGSGNDAIYGAAGNDRIVTGAGNDLLNGMEGADVMIGGLGDDSYDVDNIGDTITENANEGTDTVTARSLSWTLAANFENLTLLGFMIDTNGTGNALNNVITGTPWQNVLIGNGGNDTLNGMDGNDSLLGGDGDDILNGGGDADTMVGNAGNDTYYVDNLGDTVSEGSSTGGVDIVYSSVTFSLGPAGFVENLTLTSGSNVNGTGNALNNVIYGNNGNNVLIGNQGDDILHGGWGADTLYGGDGNDTLYGEGGGDALVGNLGDDTYYVDEFTSVSEGSSTGGLDHVISSGSFNLGPTGYAENLTLTGTGDTDGLGNASNNVIIGNSGANELWGNTGNDTLNGNDGNDMLFGGDGVDILDGGAGADAMTGNLGDDTYYVDNAGDTVSEGNIAGGVDLVYSSVTFGLGPTGYADNLTLTGVVAVDGTGNSLNNIIIGNSAANVLIGNGGDDTLQAGDGADTLLGGDGADTLDGGAGADHMTGNFGDDVYVVDNAGDVVSEGNAAGGSDHVYASVTFNLGPTGFADHLTLTGVAAINGTGNNLNNTITGNSAANTLVGAAGNDTLSGMGGADTLTGGDGNDILDGGTGADAMVGNAGDDTYYVDDAGDTVSEGLNVGGTDHVYASVSFNIAPGGFIENLTLTGSNTINGIGNSLANTITGNGGANTLTGAGGADSFVFAAPLGGGNIDAITDFTVVDDTIVLNSGVFSAIAVGTLSAGAFVIGAAAADADDRIIYDSATGALYYDADGNGAGAAVQFATLATGLALTNNDFIVGGP